MARITLDIPDELWEKLQPMSDRLPELLAMTLEQPPLPARIYQYILDFVVSKPTPEEIIAFRPTPEMQERLRVLLECSKGGKITATESKELDEYERIQHLMMMLKAGVFPQLVKFSKDEIDKLSTFEEILQYGIETIQLKDDYFFKRIQELQELCAEEEDVELSLESLKSMFLFVGTLGNISKPSSLTVSENGFFYLEWETDENNSITLRFQKDYFCDYVIFLPSRHINQEIIFNGSMYVLDLIDYLNSLKIKIHQDV